MASPLLDNAPPADGAPPIDNAPRPRSRVSLPDGVPTSLPWIVGMLCIPFAALLVNLLYPGFSGPNLPPLVLGLSAVGMGACLMAADWFRTRYRYMVELGTVAEDLALRVPAPRLARAAAPSAAPRLVGPFPVTADDEAGYLAARLNGLAAALQQSLNVAREEREEVIAILNSMDSGVVLVDGVGRVVMANPAAERLLTMPFGALRGHTLLERILHPELASMVEKASRGETGSLPLYLESSRRHVLALVSPLGDGPAGAVVVFQDQEEQRRLDSVRRDFIANVSHELRTPLASIRAMAETLQSGAMADPEVGNSFLDIIVREVDRLAHLTDDILDLARYESGRLVLAPLNVHELLVEVERQFRPRAESAGLEFQSETGSSLTVQGDHSALRQVFLNLLDNAVKYTPAGVVSFTARTVSALDAAAFPEAPGFPPPAGCAFPSAWLRVDIADSGPGIAPEHIKRIFERFYRVDRGRSRELGGTGLGLSIVRHVVEAHGGRVTVETEVGRGSTFTVWLPAEG